MNRLIELIQRLYCPSIQQRGRLLTDVGTQGHSPSHGVTDTALAAAPDGETPPALDLMDADGCTGAMVLRFMRGMDWHLAARLHALVQSELGLPAPAISVCADGGYQLWFSLEVAVPSAQAQAFLAGLCSRYLSELPDSLVALHPGSGSPAVGGSIPIVPSLNPANGRWSAYIDPSWGAMFIDEPGLELAPTMDGQTDLLARVRSIVAEDFQRVFALLAPVDVVPVVVQDTSSQVADQLPPFLGTAPLERLALGDGYHHPRQFLLAVMNDPSASANHRIEAAKALLPYFNDAEPL